MTDIRNDEELMAELNFQFIMVIDASADRIIKEIIIPSIQTNVYDAYSPQQYTHRDESSGRFIDSWEQQTTTASIDNVTSEIAVNPLLMDLDTDNFVHGSFVNGDVREMLAEYIQKGTNYDFPWSLASYNTPEGEKEAGLFTGAIIRRRDYWNPILLALQDGSVDKIIEEEMSKLGMKYIKTGGISGMMDLS